MGAFYGWKNGASNCREEQECDIVDALFTKSVKEKKVYLKINKRLVCTSQTLVWGDKTRHFKNMFLEVSFKFFKFRFFKKFYLGKKYIHPVKYL